MRLARESIWACAKTGDAEEIAQRMPRMKRFTRSSRSKDTETQRGPEQSKMIRGQTTKLKDEFRCLSPDCSGPALCLCVFSQALFCFLEFWRVDDVTLFWGQVLDFGERVQKPFVE